MLSTSNITMPIGVRPKRPRLIEAMVLFLIGCAVLLVAVYAYNFHGLPLGGQDHFGQFGDYIGGVLNPLIGLSTVVAVLVTLDRQREAAYVESLTNRIDALEYRLESLISSPVLSINLHDGGRTKISIEEAALSDEYFGEPGAKHALNKYLSEQTVGMASHFSRVRHALAEFVGSACGLLVRGGLTYEEAVMLVGRVTSVVFLHQKIGFIDNKRFHDIVCQLAKCEKLGGSGCDLATNLSINTNIFGSQTGGPNSSVQKSTPL